MALAARSSVALRGAAVASAPQRRVAPASVVVEAKQSKQDLRARRHRRVRKKVEGTPDRPRLAVFRSNQHIYAQVIDDAAQSTIVGMGTVSKAIKEQLESDKKSATKNKDAAVVLGKAIAEACLEKGVNKVVFDRGGFLYHGRVAAVADGAREGGLEF